ncbi:MAG: hypothetical protein RLZZ422_2567 [Pseudomonadota bacterium]|jgi:hypothetical protein
MLNYSVLRVLIKPIDSLRQSGTVFRLYLKIALMGI